MPIDNEKIDILISTLDIFLKQLKISYLESKSKPIVTQRYFIYFTLTDSDGLDFLFDSCLIDDCKDIYTDTITKMSYFKSEIVNYIKNKYPLYKFKIYRVKIISLNII